MAEIVVNLYEEKNYGRNILRADVRGSVGDLFGLFFSDGNNGDKVPIKPSAADFLAFESLLQSESKKKIMYAIVARISRYRKKPNLRLLEEEQPVDLEPFCSGVFIRFHNGASGDKRVYCNVKYEGIWYNGIEIVFGEEDRIQIIFPDAAGLRTSMKIISDQEAWQAISDAVVDAREKGNARSLSYDKPKVLERKEGALSSHVASTLEQDNDDEYGEQCEKKEKNVFGRVKNAVESGLYKYSDGNVLRPAKMIEQLKINSRYIQSKPSEQMIINGLSNGFINILDIELLSYLAKFKYLTSAMMIDLYSAGFIPKDLNASSFNQKHINQHVKKLEQFGLITVCRFISVDEKGDYDFNKVSIGRINALSVFGGTVLKELGRDAKARPFDAYQDGQTVRNRLCINQWVIYWIAAYPEVVKHNFGFNSIAYSLGLEMAGARIPAWVYVNDQMLIGQYVRRVSERDWQTEMDEMTGKVKRLGRLFSDLEKVVSYDGDEYVSMNLKKVPIVCYICEDESHMLETVELLRPLLLEGQMIWCTYDQRLFNYEYNEKRFLKIDSVHSPAWVNVGEFFSIGCERKNELSLS